MSEQTDDPTVADLGRVNADLTRSLRRCSGMVRDYRSRLIAANSNHAFMAHGEVGNDDRDRNHEDGERTG